MPHSVRDVWTCRNPGLKPRPRAVRILAPPRAAPTRRAKLKAGARGMSRPQRRPHVHRSQVARIRSGAPMTAMRPQCRHQRGNRPRGSGSTPLLHLVEQVTTPKGYIGSGPYTQASSGWPLQAENGGQTPLVADDTPSDTAIQDGVSRQLLRAADRMVRVPVSYTHLTLPTTPYV